MTLFDVVVLAVLAVSALLGLWRGLVSEGVALATWVVAFLAAKTFAAPAGALLASWLRDATAQWVGGFALVFVGVIALAALVRLALRELLKAAGLGVADRVLGGCFGLARGLLIVLLGVLIAGMTTLPRAEWWRGALLAPPLETLVVASKPWLPATLAKRIRYR